MLFLTPDQVSTLAAGVDDQWRTAQRRRLQGSFDDSTATLYGLVVKFAAYTGLRAGEIAALKIGDVDLDAKVVRVEKSLSTVGGRMIEELPKTKAGLRSVPVPAALCQDLKSYLGSRRANREDFFFVGTYGGPIRQNFWYRRFYRPAVLAVLPDELADLRFHDLRHTYASFLVAEDAHPKAMAELLGHSSVQITLDRYSHLFPQMLSAINERLDEVYRGAQADVRAKAPVIELM